LNSGILKDKLFQICSKYTSWKINCKYQTSDYNSASVLGNKENHRMYPSECASIQLIILDFGKLTSKAKVHWKWFFPSINSFYFISTSWKINCKYQTSDYNIASVLGQENSTTSMLKFAYFLTCASCWKYVGLILKHTHKIAWDCQQILVRCSPSKTTQLVAWSSILKFNIQHTIQYLAL
jgi:hypothetical protein